MTTTRFSAITFKLLAAALVALAWHWALTNRTPDDPPSVPLYVTPAVEIRPAFGYGLELEQPELTAF